MEQDRLSKRIISGVYVHSGPPKKWVAALDDTLEKRNVLLGYVNTHTAYLSKTDQSYRLTLRDFLLLNDGVGLDAVSRIQYGEPFDVNLNGSDFTPLFLQTTRHRFRVFLLGGKEGVARAAADALRGIAPQHSYVGNHRGHLTEAEDREVVRLIRASGANVVLVGFGNPDQEMWIARYCRELEVTLSSAWEPCWIFWREPFPGLPSGCGAPGSNGCTASCASRAACGSVIFGSPLC
jgi:alpha-1,3-mannosyltransferase